MYPENTTSLVTKGETRVGKSIGVCHLILPDFISMAVMVPFPTLHQMQYLFSFLRRIYGVQALELRILQYSQENSQKLESQWHNPKIKTRRLETIIEKFEMEARKARYS